MNVVKCPRCERYNNVPRGSLDEIRNLKCLRCGAALPVDHRHAEPESAKISGLDIAQIAAGLVFWAAGLALTLVLHIGAPASNKHRFMVGYAWAFMGMVLHLGLFFMWQPMHDFYLALWAKLSGGR